MTPERKPRPTAQESIDYHIRRAKEAMEKQGSSYEERCRTAYRHLVFAEELIRLRDIMSERAGILA